MLLYLLDAFLGEDGSGAALYNVSNAVELGGLAAQPHLVQVHALALQLYRNDGVAAAGAGEACGLGERAELNRTILCALDFIDGARHILGYEALVSGIVQDNGIVCQCVIYPSLQACAVVGSAGRVVRGAQINDVSLDGRVRQRQEAVGLVCVHVRDFAAAHNVGVHVYRIYRIRNQNRVVLVEQIQNVADVRLGAVGYKDLVQLQLGVAHCIVCLNGFLQEIITLLRTVAVEGLLLALLVNGCMHGVNGNLRQRQGDITDAQTDDLLVRMCCGVVRNLLRNRGEQIALRDVGKIMIHFHRFQNSFSLMLQ